ncbi:MAG: fumarate reductase subunit C [Deltaproteobacteria bacterium]|nr:fumarate reductase subunit C [Deltaproteobacteria bacterium]
MSEPYRRPINPSTWWLKNPNYRFVMYRELTSVFIIAFLLIFLWFLCSLARGPEAYNAFLQRLSSPWSFFFHLATLIAACFHSCTFFNLTPKAIVVRKGEEKIADAFLIAPNYVGWLTVSVVIFLIATWS